MSEVKVNPIDDFRHSISHNHLYVQKDYDRLWSVLESLGYKEEEIQVGIAEKHTDLLGELESYQFAFFFKEKIVLLEKDRIEKDQFNVTEYATPIERKRISLTHRKNDEIILSLFFKDQVKLSWATKDLFIYNNDIETVNENLRDIYKLY